jgi:hypothetical protein
MPTNTTHQSIITDTPYSVSVIIDCRVVLDGIHLSNFVIKQRIDHTNIKKIMQCFSVLELVLSFLAPQNVYVNNVLGSKHAVMWPVSDFSLQYKISVLK